MTNSHAFHGIMGFLFLGLLARVGSNHESITWEGRGDPGSGLGKDTMRMRDER
jgi:hypothetical protein